jgi:hypothetical protein
MSTNNAPAGHIQAFDKVFAATESRSFGTSGPVDQAAREEAIRLAIPADMIRQVTSKIDAIEGRLKEFRGYDKEGKPILVLSADDPRRRALDIELHFLKNHTLPYTKLQAERVAAAKAALPTASDKLRTQVEREQRIQTAAVAKAEELEVEERARRILAERRRAGGSAAV